MNSPPSNQYGNQYMFVHGRQNSGTSPTGQATMPEQPTPFNPYILPSPNPISSDVTISYSQQYSQSPVHATATPGCSPYPEWRQMQRPESVQRQPSKEVTGETGDVERTINPQPPFDQYEEYLQLKKEKEQRLREQALQAQYQQRQQMQSQSQVLGSPYISYSSTAGQVLRRPPGHMQPFYHNDARFGYPYEDLGQSHGLPGQMSQNTVAAPNGHHFGPVAITGTARIIRGNVVDSGRPFVKAKNHNYEGEMIIHGDATVWDGDQTIETANTFWQQGRIAQSDRPR